MPLLAIDVGAGTQDILLYREDISLEGSTKMVLPSQTVIVAGRIDDARRRGKDIFLQGPTMGGGASVSAVKHHLAAGLKVYATPPAAATINDNLERVEKLGIIIQDEAPASAEEIKTGDIDIPALCNAFCLFNIHLPVEIAVAVQDHGYSPNRSNRLVRFEHMANAIASGGTIEAFAYRLPPENMTRMGAVRAYLEKNGFEAILMDTGPAAIFGASKDPRCIEPAIIINFGNGHTVVAMLDGGRITSLFEHHTTQLSPEKLKSYLNKFCSGDLKNSDVFDDGGHGAYIGEIPERIESTMVTGPRRDSFLSSSVLSDAVAAAPGGDMMITGCIGLLEAWEMKDKLWR
ncbi:MAG: DUF1786 domain-containing protein [Methanotrichaceae archaeon]